MILVPKLFKWDLNILTVILWKSVNHVSITQEFWKLLLVFVNIISARAKNLNRMCPAKIYVD